VIVVAVAPGTSADGLDIGTVDPTVDVEAEPALVTALARHLDAPVVTSDHLGPPPDGKETVPGALPGFLTRHGVPVSSAPGSRRPRLLGRITTGLDPLVLPAPVPPPARLRLTTQEIVR
jgi:anhydro-N-acetylmuramic acid kinase